MFCLTPTSPVCAGFVHLAGGAGLQKTPPPMGGVLCSGPKAEPPPPLLGVLAQMLGYGFRREAPNFFWGNADGADGLILGVSPRGPTLV